MCDVNLHKENTVVCSDYETKWVPILIKNTSCNFTEIYSKNRSSLNIDSRRQKFQPKIYQWTNLDTFLGCNFEPCSLYSSLHTSIEFETHVSYFCS